MSKKIKDETGKFMWKTPSTRNGGLFFVVLIAYGAVTKGGGSLTSKNSTGNLNDNTNDQFHWASNQW